MSHCLVTFLGRVPRHKSSGEYSRVEYRFPGGYAAEAAFLGFPLREWLDADRLVVFGTASSMWDHLLEGADVRLQGAEDARIKLCEDADSGSVSQAQLDDMAPRLGEELGCDVKLTIIPTALDTAEQTQLLTMLAHAAEGSDRLSLDVTHGYRHLPMLAFTAALYLRFLRPDLQIAGLWYGSLNPGTGQAAVHDLGGLLEITDWLSALQRHEWLGDYDGIADLVANDDQTLADHLRAASFRESIHKGQQARKNIKTAREHLRAQPLHGPGELFQPALLERMAWVDEQTLYLRQRRHALGALQRHDHLRASLYGFEAFITKLTQARAESGLINDRDAREEARQVFETEYRRSCDPRWHAYRLLRNLRNVLAHGDQARGDAQKAIHSRQSLDDVLRDCFDTLLPEEPQ